jgi:sarcosine oxidase subunit delta
MDPNRENADPGRKMPFLVRNRHGKGEQNGIDAYLPRLRQTQRLRIPLWGRRQGTAPGGRGTDPSAWCDYVHMNKCTAGVQKEWWFHRDGCGSWFTTWRDTTKNLEVEQPEASK